MDPPMATSSSPVNPPPLSPPTDTKTKINDTFENELNDKMNARSRYEFWPARLQEATEEFEAMHDPDKLYNLLASVLVTLTGTLAITPPKSRYCQHMLTHDMAMGVIHSTTADERDGLISAFCKGIEELDWRDLIRHRTFNPFRKNCSA
jgi:hypothetical protein